MKRGLRLAARAHAAISLLALLALGAPAAAHTRSMSWSTWQLLPDGARIELRLKQIELTREPPGYRWATALPTELRLFAGDAACAADDATQLSSAPEGWAVFRWRVRCEGSGPRRIESRLLAESAAAHTHFLRIAGPADGAGESIRERVLMTGRDDAWWIDAQPGAPEASGFASFVSLGVLHIATGFDHLAFVIALLLLAASLREVAALVTGFTLGHSLTLALAVLGIVRPDSVAVEVLIGFSIALVAAENAWLLGGRDRIVPAAGVLALLLCGALAAFGVGALGPLAWLGLALFSACHFGLLRSAPRPGALRAAVAFAFGLVHGFGFAGILMELELPARGLVAALFGFNLGVELGQLAVVAVAWPLLIALARLSRGLHQQLAEAGSAAICGLGIFWLLSRNF